MNNDGKFLKDLIAATCVSMVSTSIYALDYYVDATGGDNGASGTSEQSPWQTIEHVANELTDGTIVAGDTVHFKRGETWRETLIVDASGLASLPITLTSYGDLSESRPLISCANDITDELWQGITANGGFEQANDSVTPTDFAGWTIAGFSSGDAVTQGVGRQSDKAIMLGVAPSGGAVGVQTAPWHMQEDVSYSGSGYLKLEALSPSAVIKLYLYTTTPNSLEQPRQYLDSNGVWQDWSSTSRQPFQTITNLSSTWQSFTIPSFTGIQGDTTYLRIDVINAGATVLVDDVMITKDGTDYWTVARGSFVPKILIEDGTRLAFGAEWDEQFSWHSVGGASAFTRYLAAPGDSPANHTIEVGARRVGILIQGQSYLVIDDIDVSGCEPHVGGTELTEGAGILLSSGSSNNVIKNVTVSNSDHGIRVQGKNPSTQAFNNNNLIEQVVVKNGISQGIAIRSESGSNTIRNSIVHDLNMLSSDNIIEDKEPISIGGNTGNAPGNIIEGNEVYNIGVDADKSVGIVVFNSPDTIIRNNYVHDIGKSGILIGTNNASPYGYKSDNMEIHHNVIARTGLSNAALDGQGIGVSVSDHGDIDNVDIFNNTIVDCRLDGNKDGGISLRGVANSDSSVNTISNIQIKNNIVSGCAGAYPRALYVAASTIADVQSLDSNHNVFYPGSSVGATGQFIFYRGVSYTKDEFANYRADTQQDQNSLVGAPLFVNEANHDFHLHSSSPAINAGIDVGLTLDFEGSPVVNDPLTGNSPEVGIYEFPDIDLDGIPDSSDNCPYKANSNQTDSDGDTIGNVCDTETLPALVSLASEDGWVRESGEHTNVGGSHNASGSRRQAIRIGDHGNRRQYKAMLSFDIQSLPPEAIVTSARLELVNGNNTKGDPSNLGLIYVDLSVNGFSGNTALENADFEAIADVPMAAVLTDNGSGMAEAIIDEVGLAIMAGNPVVQFRLAYELDDNNDNVRDTLGFYSANNNTSNNHPRLFLEYRLPD